MCVCVQQQQRTEATLRGHNIIYSMPFGVVAWWCRGGGWPHMTRAIDIFVTFSKTIKCAARPHMATTENRPRRNDDRP